MHCNYLTFSLFNINFTADVPTGGVLNSHNSSTTKKKVFFHKM